MQRAVTVGVQGFEIRLVGGEELQAAQEAFPVAGYVQGGLAVLVPAVDVRASLFQKFSYLFIIVRGARVVGGKYV